MSKATKSRLIKDLGVRVDDDPQLAERTATGLVRVSDGVLMPPLRKPGARFDRPIAPEPEPEPAQPPSRSRRRKAQPEPVPVQEERSVKVKVTVEGLGVVPSEYRHIWTGRGVVVLGLTDMSYLPPVGMVDEDGSVTGAVELSVLPGERLVFSGQDFNDGKCKNLIMLRLGRGEEDDDDDEQDQ